MTEIDWIVLGLVALAGAVLLSMWRECILRPCKWDHLFDVPRVDMPAESFGVYQCRHCKCISTGVARWMEGF